MTPENNVLNQKHVAPINKLAADAVNKVIPAPETILNEPEAAKYLKVSRPTLHRWRKSSSIRFYRAGFRVLYSVEKHLRPFLDNCEEIAAAEQAANTNIAQ